MNEKVLTVRVAEVSGFGVVCNVTLDIRASEADALSLSFAGHTRQGHRTSPGQS